MKVIAIDASSKPETIPNNLWIVEGNEYTVIKIDKLNMQGGIEGYQLEELDLYGCFPYTHFSAKRFVPSEQLNAESEAFVEELLAEELEEVF